MIRYISATFFEVILSVILKKRRLQSGKESFVLYINHKGKRWTENLKGLELVPEYIIDESLSDKDKKVIERENKEIRKKNIEAEQTAENCKILRQSELIRNANNLPTEKIEYFEKHYIEFLNTKTNNDTYQAYLVVFESLKRYLILNHSEYKEFLKPQDTDPKKKKKELTVKQVDRSFLRGYVKFLSDNKVTSNSQRLYLDRIRHFFNFLKKEKVVTENPISEIDLPKVRTHQREHLSIEEIQHFAESSDGINPTVRDMFLFGAFTGLRVSDLRSLKWSDFRNNFEYFTIRVQKTQKILTLKLSAPAKEILNSIPKTSDRVFKRFSQHTMRYHLIKWTKQANFDKNITIHTARHSFAVNYLSSGGDIFILSKLLGHSNLKTTQIYADIVNKRLDEAMQLFDNVKIKQFIH